MPEIVPLAEDRRGYWLSDENTCLTNRDKLKYSKKA